MNQRRWLHTLNTWYNGRREQAALGCVPVNALEKFVLLAGRVKVVGQSLEQRWACWAMVLGRYGAHLDGFGITWSSAEALVRNFGQQAL